MGGKSRNKPRAKMGNGLKIPLFNPYPHPCMKLLSLVTSCMNALTDKTTRNMQNGNEANKQLKRAAPMYHDMRTCTTACICMQPRQKMTTVNLSSSS